MLYFVQHYGCYLPVRKKFEDYYERPASLEPPIYQQLEARGNFTSLLKAIDKAGYKHILSSTGYWTFFAPHDDAFAKYLADKKLGSVDEMDSVACRAIVTYCLVYNAFRKDRLDDYQSPQAASLIPHLKDVQPTTLSCIPEKTPVEKNLK